MKAWSSGGWGVGVGVGGRATGARSRYLVRMGTYLLPLVSTAIRPARVLALAALACAAALLPGCVAFEIRDSVRETNARLCELTPALGQTIHSIEDTRAEVERTRVLLQGVQADVRDVREQVALVRASLDRTDGNLAAVGSTLGETNPKLNRVDGGLDRLSVLNRLNESLERTNKALEPLASAAGLLGTLETGIGLVTGDTAPPAPPTPAPSDPAAPSTSNAAAPAASPPQPAPAPATTAKPADPLVGTWLQVYPPAAVHDSQAPEARDVLILRPDGTYLSAATGTRPQSGTWSRIGAGRTLSLALDTASVTPNTPNTPAAPPPAATYDLLTLTARTMTLRTGDAVRVYTRP